MTCVHKFELQIPMLYVNVNLKGNAMNESFFFYLYFYYACKINKKIENKKIKEIKSLLLCLQYVDNMMSFLLLMLQINKS